MGVHKNIIIDTTKVIGKVEEMRTKLVYLEYKIARNKVKVTKSKTGGTL